MYDTTVIPTYHYYDPTFSPFRTEKFDQDDVEGLEDCADMVYQAEFLRAFSLNHLDTSTAINSLIAEVKHLFDVLKLVDAFAPILQKSSEHFDCVDEKHAFKMLFSYHYFFAMHALIKSVLEDDVAQRDTHLGILLKLLEHKF